MRNVTDIIVVAFLLFLGDRIGRLVANREVPVLKRAKDLLDVKE